MVAQVPGLNRSLTGEEQRAIFGRNACRFYRLNAAV
jgi:hypothetical protein